MCCTWCTKMLLKGLVWSSLTWQEYCGTLFDSVWYGRVFWQAHGALNLEERNWPDYTPPPTFLITFPTKTLPPVVQPSSFTIFWDFPTKTDFPETCCASSYYIVSAGNTQKIRKFSYFFGIFGNYMSHYIVQLWWYLKTEGWLKI